MCPSKRFSVFLPEELRAEEGADFLRPVLGIRVKDRDFQEKNVPLLFFFQPYIEKDFTDTPEEPLLESGHPGQIDPFLESFENREEPGEIAVVLIS